MLLFFAVFHGQGQLEDKDQVACVWCVGAASQPPGNGRVSGRHPVTLMLCSRLGWRQWTWPGADTTLCSGSCQRHLGWAQLERCLWQRWVEPPQVCLIPGPPRPFVSYFINSRELPALGKAEKVGVAWVWSLLPCRSTRGDE